MFISRLGRHLQTMTNGNGQRFINSSQHQKAVTLQRLGTTHYKGYINARLADRKAPLLRFHFFDDTQYSVFMQQIDEAMRKGAAVGLKRVLGPKRKEGLSYDQNTSLKQYHKLE